MANAVARPRNDPAQYDDLAGAWWDPYGAFAALNWLARVRARLVPPPPFPDAPLLDVACGGGLLAPWLRGPLAGWRHVGIDLNAAALRQARDHGVAVARADALALPFQDGSLHCVVAGEILEHVPDLDAACAELARVLAPSGTLVVDTIADTRFARVMLVAVAERFHGGPPPGIHDPDLFVDPRRLRRLLAGYGVRLDHIVGLRPSLLDCVRWRLGRLEQVRMLRVRSTAGVYQAVGVKDAEPSAGTGPAAADVSAIATADPLAVA